MSVKIFVNHGVPQCGVLGTTKTSSLYKIADNTIFSCRCDPGRKIAAKIETFLLETGEIENILLEKGTLNADKTEYLYEAIARD